MQKTLIQRDGLVRSLLKNRGNGLIKVVTGVRRCGKSVLLFDLFTAALAQLGVRQKRIIRVNLEDMENVALRDAAALYGFIKRRLPLFGQCIVMLDEIQYVERFEDLLNTLNNHGCDVYVTGSNSKMLSGEISSALRGRSVEIKVAPLSFAEYFSFAKGEPRRAFNDYLTFGGFPYVATERDRGAKIAYLQMLEGSVATRDVVERHKIRNGAAFNAVYDFLCSNIGGLVSAKKISDTLKTAGFKTISCETVGDYLQALCGAFLFHKAVRYDIKGKEYLKTLNKYYAVDLGLRNAHLNWRQIEPTHALENAVFLELLRRGWRVDVGKNRAKEVDFVASNAAETVYVQVAYSVADEQKRAAELASFSHIDDGWRKLVITMDDDPFTILDGGIKKLSAIDFFLNGISPN